MSNQDTASDSWESLQFRDIPSDGALPDDRFLEDHSFALRRIQHQIIRIVRKLEHEAARDNHIVPNLWRSSIRYSIEEWMSGVAVLSTHQTGQKGFTSLTWLTKLANYAIISLFPNCSLAVRSGDARHLVSAACDALNTFHRLRVREQTSCYTWTAVSSFRPGISHYFY